jgi:competence protein ComEA
VIKKLMLAIAAMIASMSMAFAQVDVNKADATALDSIRGVGPKMSNAILTERTKGGAFKDWADLQSRVKGIGDKNAARLSAAGLTVGGKAKDGAAAAPAAAKPAKTGAKPEKGATAKS